jgi:hypothetical protein
MSSLGRAPAALLAFPGSLDPRTESPIIASPTPQQIAAEGFTSSLRTVCIGCCLHSLNGVA